MCISWKVCADAPKYYYPKYYYLFFKPEYDAYMMAVKKSDEINFVCSIGKNGTITNGTSLAPSANSTTSGCPSLYFYGSGSFTTSVIIGVVLMSAVFL